LFFCLAPQTFDRHFADKIAIFLAVYAIAATANFARA
jgi:AcrR family transcriptional regulator